MSRTYQTMAEIEKLYPNEWVLIDDPKATKYHVVLGGFVVSHGTDKLAVYDEVNKLPKPFNIAVFYLGDVVDPGEEILLNVGLFL